VLRPTRHRRAARHALDLANWFVSRENPLAARAFVNRLWRLFFGIGISRTADDLGSQGEWPVHPNCSTGWRASSWTPAETSSTWSGSW